MAATIDRGRDALVPNLVSFARIPLAGLLWVAPEQPAWTLAVLFAAGVSDVLDGWLVRRIRKRRLRDHDPGALAASAARGAFIDGLADKIFVMSAVALLATTLHPPAWAIVMLIMREILFIPLMLAYRFAPASMRQRVDFTAGKLGKAATITQFLAIVLGLLHHTYFVHAAVVAGLTGAAAALQYALRAFASTTGR